MDERAGEEVLGCVRVKLIDSLYEMLVLVTFVLSGIWLAIFIVRFFI